MDNLVVLFGHSVNKAYTYVCLTYYFFVTSDRSYA